MDAESKGSCLLLNRAERHWEASGRARQISPYQGEKGVEGARQRALQAAEECRETIDVLKMEKLSLNAMAARLNADSVRTSRGGKWTATAVKRIITRLA